MKIPFKLRFCLAFANFDSQTNKLFLVQTLHSTLYTVQKIPYMPDLSTSEKNQGRGHMWISILWLNSRLVLSFTLCELASIFYTYLFRIFYDSPNKYVLSYIFDKYLEEQSLIIMYGRHKKCLSITPLLSNKQTKC